MASNPLKMLIVDDSAISRKILKAELTQSGYSNFVEAQTGEEALKFLYEERNSNPTEKFALIFMDINMPGLNGLETSKKIREMTGGYAQIPIIMVSAESDKAKIIEALTIGVSDYILKPFAKGSVEEKIKKVIEKIKK